MTLVRLATQSTIASSFFYLINAVHAGVPVWSFVPDSSFPPKVTVTSTGTATVQYYVTNNSSKPHNLVLKPQSGVGQNGACVLGARGSVNATCTLTLTITGSALPASGVSGGPVLCQANTDGTANTNFCYQPANGNRLDISVTQAPSVLSVSTSNLALSVNDTGTNAALTGTPRVLTITNTGSTAAAGLSISYPSWPTGTTVNTSSPSACTAGSTLAAGASCTITVVPGSIATSGCTTGNAPVPGVVSVSATGYAPVSSNVVVLGYGCQYQGGFVYAVDDTTPATSSVGGKVVSLVDQAEPSISSGPQATSIIWSSNGNGFAPSDVDYTAILGIDETSTVLVPSPTTPAYPPGTPAFIPCEGMIDGACNSGNIISYYNANNGSGLPPTNLTYYAAGLCAATISGYSDWYLPAVCEMDAVSNFFVNCPAGAQSMVGSLPFLIGDFSSISPPPSESCAPPPGTNCLAGNYWGSTEVSAFPADDALGARFDTGFGSVQSGGNKVAQRGIRCSRALTP